MAIGQCEGRVFHARSLLFIIAGGTTFEKCSELTMLPMLTMLSYSNAKSFASRKEPCCGV